MVAEGSGWATSLNNAALAQDDDFIGGRDGRVVVRHKQHGSVAFGDEEP